MSSLRVLVVDDSASTCLFIASALQNEGYEVAIAHDGQMCLASLKAFKPHCLILDVLLPDISGYALCRQIRRSLNEQQLILILISAKGSPLDVSYGLRQGADRYLPKPFTAETLLKEIREVVSGAQHHVALPATPVNVSQRHVAPPATPVNVSQHTPQALLALIPRRVIKQDALRNSNPFAHPSLRRDQRNPQLLAVIDGRKTVAELAAVTGLTTEMLVAMLRELLREGEIQLMNQTGQVVQPLL